MNTIERNVDDYDEQIFKDLDYMEGYLESKNFRRCNFKHCNFMQCEFVNCSFVDCLFENCDFSLVKHKKTHFANLVFKKSKAIGVDWTDKFSFKIQLEFHNCVINYSVFMGLELKKFKLIDSTVHEADFTDAKMKDAVCTGCDFQDTVFLRTNLAGSDFTKAINYTINPQNNNVRKTKFSLPDVLNLLSEFGVIVDGLE